MATSALDPSPWRPMKIPGLMETIGPFLAKREGDAWRYGLQTGPQHANTIGRVHGGTITALADQAMAMYAWEAVNRQPVVTIHMDTRFVAAASPGDFLEADVTIKHRTSSILFVEVSITTSGQAVALASGILQVVRPRTGEAQR
jgi:uncharacterized protein (TIGR00369 family)